MASASASITTSIEERERALAERAKALDEREKDMARRENSFELQSLQGEWDSLVDAESKLYRMKRLTSFELDERESKLERKTHKLEQLEALLQIRQNDIDRGIFYR
jgi:hypothetical protein